MTIKCHTLISLGGEKQDFILFPAGTVFNNQMVPADENNLSAIEWQFVNVGKRIDLDTHSATPNFIQSRIMAGIFFLTI